MALVTQFTCTKCERPRFEIVLRDGLCAECRTTIAKIKREAFMKECELMPIEARVRRLEGILYDLNADDRLKALEAMNIRYS